jgi:hypothetical protein
VAKGNESLEWAALISGEGEQWREEQYNAPEEPPVSGKKCGKNQRSMLV